MKIQSINYTMPAYACQPIRQVDFARKKTPAVQEEAQFEQSDFNTQSSKDIMEQKYDLACRIAAYYKTQYEQLLKNGYCVV